MPEDKFTVPVLDLQAVSRVFGGLLHQKTHLGMARHNIGLDSEFFQRLARGGSDGCDHHAAKTLVNRFFQAIFSGNAEQMRQLAETRELAQRPGECGCWEFRVLAPGSAVDGGLYLTQVRGTRQNGG